MLDRPRTFYRQTWFTPASGGLIPPTPYFQSHWVTNSEWVMTVSLCIPCLTDGGLWFISSVLTWFMVSYPHVRLYLALPNACLPFTTEIAYSLTIKTFFNDMNRYVFVIANPTLGPTQWILKMYIYGISKRFVDCYSTFRLDNVSNPAAKNCFDRGLMA